MEYHVLEAVELGERVVVLFDPMAKQSRFGQFANLVAFTKTGEKLWTAELATTEPGDCYYSIVSKEPLVAISWKSWACEIDYETGTVVKREFFK